MKKLFYILFVIVSPCFIQTSGAQIITTVAGTGVQSFGGDGGQATSAKLNSPRGVAFDGSDNLYIADQGNSRIRKVNTSGIITTVAGNGVESYSGDGGAATSAELANPYGDLDLLGNLYIADATNELVRIVNSSGIINISVGKRPGGFSGDGGPATSAELHNPLSLTFDNSGNMYIADQVNNRIRKVNTSGTITTFAGSNHAGYSGDGGQATAAELHTVDDVAVDASGNIYIADNINNCIRKVNTSGVISTIVGNGTAGYSGDGGQATAAEIDGPTGVSLDANGNIYVSDNVNACIRKINTSGVISTFVGNGTAGFAGDGGQATAAEIKNPYKVRFDAFGNMYISDAGNMRIREVYLVLNVSTSVTVNISCYGGNNGSATATPTHGTTPYTYSWSNGATNATATGLSAGTYTITVTDNDGITGSETINLSQPTLLSVSASVTANVTCNGGSNGSVSSTVSGGTSPYTYSWSGSGTNSTKTGLTAGTYTVTVTDNNGCTATASATVTQPATLSVSASVTANVSCNGASNGSVSATPSDGTSPYTYSWSGGGTNSTKTGLTAGTYTITLTDNCGTTVTASVTITQPAALSVAASVSSGVSCYGGNNGSVSATPSGGTSPYTYSWSNGATTAIASGLSAGNYSVTVTDANNCSATASVTLTNPSTLRDSISTHTNVSCYGESDGQATVGVSGGTPGYSYNWSPSGGTGATASGLSAGTYTVTVTDSNGCTTTASIIITQPPCTPNPRSFSISNVWQQ